MEMLQLLGIALGLATLAGIDLYLTVFCVGLLMRFHWVAIPESLQAFDILAHPAILIIAGTLYVIEFIIDKIPWFDSVWDTVHTLLRPIGGMLLAMLAVKQMSPMFGIGIPILAGCMALVAHGIKAGTRAIINSSRGSLSNIAISLIEDAAVAGGLWLLWYHNPIIMLVICTVFVVISLLFMPGIFKIVRLKLWFAWKKLNQPASSNLLQKLSNSLPFKEEQALTDIRKTDESIDWAVYCVANKGHRLPAGRFGYLVGAKGKEPFLYFVSGSGTHAITRVLDLQMLKAHKEPKYLSENLIFVQPDGRNRTTFLFDRSAEKLIDAILEDIESRLDFEIELSESPTDSQITEDDDESSPEPEAFDHESDELH